MIAIEKLVLIIILLVILVLFVVLFMSGKSQTDVLWLQNELRECCQTYRANGCLDRAGSSLIKCNDKFLPELIDELKMDIGDNTLKQTKVFCCCHTCPNGICECGESFSSCPQDCGGS